jgi:hypothetical protein
MTKQYALRFLLLLLFYIPLSGIDNVLTLKTENMDEVIGIYSFLMNTKGEIFLYSSKMARIFKFKPDGTFEKSFCREGEGPGEIKRVLGMFHNPQNDYLYLPEYVSGGKGRITIYDSNGNYKGLLTPEISLNHMDRVWKIMFLKDGSYYLITQERVGWEPIGSLFKTQEEAWVRYFNPMGKMISDIYKTTVDDELSNAVRYGGPQILLKPSLLVKLTPDNCVAITKTDENIITVYDNRGEKVKIITLDISREKLTDTEFEAAKKLLVKLLERSDGRMQELGKKMIKLEYKPFYHTCYLVPQYILLSKILKKDDYGYTKETQLIFFDWQGKKKGEKVIQGAIYGIQDDRVFIVSFDDEGNEYFRIESNLLTLE